MPIAFKVELHVVVLVYSGSSPLSARCTTKAVVASSQGYNLHHRNRHLPGPRRFAAMVSLPDEYRSPTLLQKGETTIQQDNRSDVPHFCTSSAFSGVKSLYSRFMPSLFELLHFV